LGNVCRILVGKPEGKRLPRKWEDIKINVTEIGWLGVDWIHLAWDRLQWWALVNTVMDLWVA
jgi:hypothetical protein